MSPCPWPHCPRAVASQLSWALPGRGAVTLQGKSFEPCRDAELDVALSWICTVLSFSKVTSGCEHAERFLCQAAVSHQWDSLQVGDCLFQELQTSPLLKECRWNRDGPIMKRVWLQVCDFSVNLLQYFCFECSEQLCIS